ncbi:Hypothetical predicted protein, partial [Mytilus galloprovincialis]
MSENQFCDPCSSRNLMVASTHYCQDCEEKYCDTCTTSHQNQKATKDHRIMANNIFKKMCDPCNVNSKETTGSYVCEECEEFLCTECKAHHTLQKQNTDHTIKSIVEKIHCDPCHRADRREHARYFCQDCTDPEPLCQTCANQHQAMKMTKNHKLSADIATYILRYENTQKRDTIKSIQEEIATNMDHGGDQKMCEPCNYNNITSTAVHYCEDCDERYCNKCILKHNSNRRFAHHNVVNLNDLMKSMDICEPCKFNNDNVRATYICENCIEYLCGDCKRGHLSHKKQRHHNVTPLLSSFFCTNCQGLGNTVNATNFCTNCEDLLCETCSADHKSMKKTRGHTLTPDMA